MALFITSVLLHPKLQYERLELAHELIALSLSLTSVFRAIAFFLSYRISTKHITHFVYKPKRIPIMGKFRENNLIYYPLRVQFLFWFCLFYNHFSFQPFESFFVAAPGWDLLRRNDINIREIKKSTIFPVIFFFHSLCQSLATLRAKLFHFDSANNNCVICSESFGDTIKYSSRMHRLCSVSPHNFYCTECRRMKSVCSIYKLEKFLTIINEQKYLRNLANDFFVRR